MEPGGVKNLLHQQVQAYQFTLDQRLWIALEKEKGTNTSLIKAQFSIKWPGKAPPASKNTIYRIWKKLKNTHTVQNLNKGRSGRKRSGRSEENLKRGIKLVQCQGEAFEGRRGKAGIRL